MSASVLVLAFLLSHANLGASPTALDTSGWVAPPLLAADAPVAAAPPEPVLVARAAPSAAPAPAAEVVGAPEAAPEASDDTHFGVLLDAGVPDGAGVSLVLRPWRFLRLHAGVTTNLFSAGVRGGVSLVPFHFWVTPTLTLEGGYIPAGDANGLARIATGDETFNTPALDKVSYGFANAQLGLEVGPPRRFTFYLRAGLSYLDGNLGGLAGALSSADPTVESKDLHLRLTMPSAKLGFIVYFL